MTFERIVVRLVLLVAMIIVAVIALLQQGGISPVFWATIAAVLAVVCRRHLSPTSPASVRTPRGCSGSCKVADGKAIPVLLPGDAASVSLGTSHALFAQNYDTSTEGTIRFADASGTKHSKTFIISAERARLSLVHTQEEPRTLYELQQIPKALKEIAKQISDLGGRSNTRR